MQYEFKFTLDKNQFKKAVKECKQIKRKIDNPRVRKTNSTVAAFFITMLLITFLLVSGFNFTLSAMALIVLVLVILILARLTNKLEIYKLQLKKYLDSEQRIIIDSEAVTVNTKCYSTCYNWGFIKDVVDVSEYVFIVTLEGKIIIIPKLVFNNIDEMHELCKFIKQSIENVSFINDISSYIEKLGGEIQHCERALDEEEMFYTQEKERYIYKFQYKINNELKEGWVRFGTPHGADWKL